MVRARALLTAILSVGGAIAFLCPAPATAAGAAVGSIAGSRAAALSHWTRARREGAEPLSIRTLAGSAPRGPGTTTADEGPVTEAAAIEGEDTGESTLYPDRTNGKIYGIYEIHKGPRVEVEEYECSAGVVDSAAGGVVLTAGHCVVDAETGTVAREVIFVPGYREGVAPYGRWAATSYATTEEWADTAGTRDPDEAGDVAMLVLAEDSEGKSVEDVVGALGVAFEQSREQTYTQYGYPAEEPYDGEVLYRHTAAYAGSDPKFSPAPIKIASDFTAGSSGGPWTIGPAGSPTVVSLTDYGYEKEPGYLYGAYFGEAVRTVYESVSGEGASTGSEGTGGSPGSTEGAVPTGRSSTAQAGTETPSTATGSVSLRLTAIRRRADGSAVMSVKVGGAGVLRLTGPAVRADSLRVAAGGTYRLTVVPEGAARRRLRRSGVATVGIRIAFTAAGTTRGLSRSIRLRGD